MDLDERSRNQERSDLISVRQIVKQGNSALEGSNDDDEVGRVGRQ